MSEHNERIARLNAALSTDVPVTDREETTYPVESELEHIETHLNKHGLSIAAMLRTVAKNFHGIDIPVFHPTED